MKSLISFVGTTYMVHLRSPEVKRFDPITYDFLFSSISFLFCLKWCERLWLRTLKVKNSKNHFSILVLHLPAYSYTLQAYETTFDITCETSCAVTIK